MKLFNSVSRFRWLFALLCVVWLMPANVYGQVAFRGATSANTISSDITHIGAGASAGWNNGCVNLQPSIPGGDAGDLLIALVNAREWKTIVTMPGWNFAYSGRIRKQFRGSIYWRLATGGDPNTVNQSGVCSSTGAQISRFSGVDSVQPFENIPIPAGNVVRQTSKNLDSGIETTTIDRSMLVVAGFIDDNRNVNPDTGWSESFDTVYNLKRDLAISLHYQLQTIAGPASISNWDFTGNTRERNIGVIMALRPAVNALTINVPAGTVANDVMIASIAVRPCSSTDNASCTLTVAPPAGWVLIDSFDQTSGGSAGAFGNRLFVYLRVAGAVEPANYSWRIGGSPVQSGAVGGILSFSDVDTSNPLVAQAGQLTQQGLMHATPSIDTGTVANTVLLSTHMANTAANWTPPAGMIEAVDIASASIPNTAGISLEMNYQTQINAGSTGSRAATHSPPANGVGATHLLALRPIAGVIPGDLNFNAFETSTPAGATTGRLFTKLVGANFAFDIVSISAGAQLGSFDGAVVVDLVANTSGSLLLDVNNCPLGFSLIQTLTPNPTISGGRVTVNFLAMGSAYRDVRVRMRYPAASPTWTNCSTDNFAIRPLGLTVSSTNATQTGGSGTPVIKTGVNFNLIATSVTGYDGTPSIDNTKIIGTPTAGTIGGNFNPALAVNGVASGTGFFYSEAGNFGLNSNAVFDASFTAVDQVGDCTTDFSNVMVGGRYGCSFGSSAIPQATGSSGFGRFIPDNFLVSFNVPQFTTACATGAFGYIGQPFVYTTAAAPVMTVTARNGINNGLANATTRNYAGAYMKLTNSSLMPASQAARYLRFDTLGGGVTPTLDTSGLPATTVDPVIGTFINGVGTLSFSSGTTGLTFSRGSAVPSAPFDADIVLAVNVIDADGVAFAGNPASFGAATAGNGITFSNGKNMRYGRLRLQNALGSELLALQVPMTVQYWNGTGFVINSQDNCTQIEVGNIGLANYTGQLTSNETTVTTGAAFTAGVGQLTLSAPGIGNNGSVDLIVNSGAAATEAPCILLGPDPVTSGANRSFLRGRWCGNGYDKDPIARVIFGIYRGANEIIYIREQY